MASRPPFDVLCPICKSFLEEADWIQSAFMTYRFHSTLNDAKAAGEGGCHLCSLIVQSVDCADRIEDDRKGRTFDQLLDEGIELWAEIHHGENPFDCYDQEIRPKNGARLKVTGKETKMNSVAFETVFFLFSTLGDNYDTPGSHKMANILGRRANLTKKFGSSSLKQLKSWISSCPDDCSSGWNLSSSGKVLPTRLLDVGFQDNCQDIRVISTEYLPPTTIYLTLSHCWGTISFIKLTTQTFTEMSQRIRHESLPRTFQDAVELTRCLGYRYIWIDSLCIVQDSREDWLQESSRMAQVYSRGLLNISATASDNGNGGLFQDALVLSTSPCILNSKTINMLTTSSYATLAMSGDMLLKIPH
jgi:hypothetical protein